MASRGLRAIFGLVRLALLPAGLLLAVLAGTSPMAQVPSRPELIMFDEAGCPWCRRWDEEVGPAYPRSEEGRRAPLRRIHISEARRSGIKLVTAVTVTPTFVLVDDGAEIGRITGYPGADFFWGMLDGLMDRLPRAPAAAPATPRDAGLLVPRDQQAAAAAVAGMIGAGNDTAYF